MTVFQIIMLAATGFFAYKMYEHIQSLEDSDATPQRDSHPSTAAAVQSVTAETLLDEADKAFEEGDMQAAKRLLLEAQTKDEKHIDILRKLGFIAAKEGQLDEAIEYYDKALTIDSQDDMVHNAIASIYRQQGEFEKAREHYEKAIAIDPNYEVSYFNFANLLVDMQELEAAKRMYKKALEIDPELMQAKFELEKLS